MDNFRDVWMLSAMATALQWSMYPIWVSESFSNFRTASLSAEPVRWRAFCNAVTVMTPNAAPKQTNASVSVE